MFKKLWLLVSLIAVMSLTTGLAFGHWSNLAYTNATMTTGVACVEIVGNPFQLDGSTQGPNPAGDDWTLKNPDAPLNIATNPLAQTNKNMANCTVLLVDGDIYITMNNVYPTYANEFSVDLYNCGTVPMEETNVTFIPTNNPQGTVVINDRSYLQLDLNGDGINDTEIVWAGTFLNGHNVLCPGEIPAEMSFYIHFLEAIPPHATFVLQIHINFENCETND